MFIDCHILQTVPPSNINRDDTGSPKSASFGGVRRARVSSQSWKRATRKRFNQTLDTSEIGYRTRKLADLLGHRIREAEPELADDAHALASKVFAAGGIKMTTPKGKEKKPDESGYLVFLSAVQLDSLCELALSAHRAGEQIDKKRVKEIITSNNSVDIALFGRMVADDAELNVDASAQVAHALSVHAVEPEFDYFTAVDDFQESQQETGAGMIGTVEFNSSTLYRYAAVNVPALQTNLGDTAATAKAVAAFTDSFALSMPSGKQNSFANNVVPDAVVIAVRDDQPINLVGAFEEPIRSDHGDGILARAAQRLAAHAENVAAVYGPPSTVFHSALRPAAGELQGLGECLPFRELVSRVEALVADELGGEA